MEKKLISKEKKNPDMLRFAPFACHFSTTKNPFLRLGRFAPSSTPRYARLSMNNWAYFWIALLCFLFDLKLC